MKRTMLAFSLIMLVAGFGLAQSAVKSDSSEMAKTITGEVVSASATEIAVKDKMGGEVHLLVDNSTKITREGKSITPDDVKVGDMIAADCEATGETLTAKSIRVTPVKPKP